MPEQNIEELKQGAITKVTKQVFPFTTNNRQTLFGGIAMQWLDEVGFITATRFTRQNMVTVSMDKIDFKVPIPSGCIVDLVGEIEHVGRTSVGVMVTVTREDMYAGDRVVAMTGKLSFVAVDEDTRPIILSVHSVAD
ncbi:MAG: acyl-CoA thioesterase [Xanthomonadales bacterium]|nr:acyl-CoA thioesterase [Xanthomonadales bacterium]